MKNILLTLFITLSLFLRCAKPTQSGNHHKNPVVQKKRSSPSKKNTLVAKIKQLPPIKMTKAELLKNQYSSHKDIRIAFKNVGQKTIKGIKFEWFCINSFDKPASGRSFYGEGRFTDNSTHLLKPNQIRTEFWEDFSTDADEIIEIRPYYIVYTDGTKWVNNDDYSDPLILKGYKKK